MNKFEKMSDKLAQLATVLNGNRFLSTIKDAFMFSLPLTIIGSIFTVIANFPGLSDSAHFNLNEFFGPTTTICLQLLSLFVSFAIGFYYSYNKSKQPIDSLYIGATTLASFLILVPAFSVEADSYIPIAYLGASGMFLAIINGFIGASIFGWLVKRNITIKMPASVPPTVAKSFASLIPAAAVILLATIVSYVFTYTETGNVIDVVYNIIQKPLTGVGTSFIGTIIAGLAINFLWFFGIHGSLTVNPIFEAFWQSNALDNLENFKNNEALTHIVTKSFFDTFYVGVAGYGLIGLLIAVLIFSKAKQQREVSKLAMGPVIFNVTEPILFGMPIVLNPIYLIPWLLSPIILISMAYGSMYFGLVPLTTGVTVPWTVPPIISGFLATNSILGSLLQFAQIAVMFFVWIPFVKIASKVEKAREL